jgi:GTP cyclohydrolase II
MHFCTSGRHADGAWHPAYSIDDQHPRKGAQLASPGIEVPARHTIAANGVNNSYLETKARRFGHLLAI